MKNTFKLFFTIIFAGIFLFSCDEEVAFDALTKEPDANATYYLQFQNATQQLETTVNNDGEMVNIEEKITVVLMGMPQSSDIVVPLKLDPSSTISSDMYQLSANSITIPAGKSSGFVTVKSVYEKMPIAEHLKLVMTIDVGEHNAPTGTTLNYGMYRIEYCYTVLEELVGSWSGTDAWDYPTEVTTWMEDGKLMINGIGFGWFQDWWGEVIVTNTPLVMTVNQVTGTFTIEEQPYLTSTWNGDPQPAYGLSGSGKIDACNKVITLDYIFHQGGGTFDGTSWGPKFKEVITLQ